MKKYAMKCQKPLGNATYYYLFLILSLCIGIILDIIPKMNNFCYLLLYTSTIPQISLLKIIYYCLS